MKAFPSEKFLDENRGMDLRDWFAGMALSGLMAAKHPQSFKYYAEDAYATADEMMKVRDKK